MIKLEYLRVVARALDDVNLDTLGEEGWLWCGAEVRHHSTTYLFARPKQEQNDNG